MALHIIAFATALFACAIGTLSGMGGGIIIKPVLDATGTMTVSMVTFLSGCTVILMTVWTLGKSILKKESVLDYRNTTFLAVSAAVGGLLGKELFNLTAKLFENADRAGGVQAVLLFAATLASLVYTVKKDKIRSKQVCSPFALMLIGLFLGTLGSFLGIGGGPFNVAVLFYFLSMPTKKATQNSLYIVLCSQIASTGKTVISNGFPDISLAMLAGMVVCGVLGSEVGRGVHRRIDERRATWLFEGAMVLVMAICVYNAIHFFS